MGVYQALLNIQSELKAPKNQFNQFGKYYYRNCEDILEAVKPLLKKEGCTLYIQDEIVKIDDRYYVKAKVTLVNIESGETISTTAYAREEESKKGMDSSQVTGASSSYARKYALNGLFCIDDTKDSDTTNDGKDKAKEESENEEVKRLEKAINSIAKLVKQLQENGVEKGIIVETIKQHHIVKGKGSANYNSISDLEIATKVYKALSELVKKEEN